MQWLLTAVFTSCIPMQVCWASPHGSCSTVSCATSRLCSTSGNATIPRHAPGAWGQPCGCMHLEALPSLCNLLYKCNMHVVFQAELCSAVIPVLTLLDYGARSHLDACCALIHPQHPASHMIVMCRAWRLHRSSSTTAAASSGSTLVPGRSADSSPHKPILLHSGRERWRGVRCFVHLWCAKHHAAACCGR